MTLALDDFPAVFTAVHGNPPFAWQTRLLHTVVAEGWPDVIAAPTGAGKTTVLDIALFHLALTQQPRTAPRRIAFAVDRRIIVDQAFDHATKLCKKLDEAPDGPLAAMAEALRAAGGGDTPLHVAQLRGGMPLEDDWARTPTQPTILCTTIDQLGSRLLFRGYGVSRSMAPVHAGLLGEDTLILLDEAHLSEAFHQTLSAIRARRTRGRRAIDMPWHASALTATPLAAGARSFVLTEAEREEPAIRPRLIAPKSAWLRPPLSDAPGSTGHAEAIAAEADALIQQCERAAPVIAAIVNRVGLARQVYRTLRDKKREAILLTGRVRPVERDELIEKLRTRLAGNEASAEAGPLFVVATQCVEAGADFSFDAMVTQIASLDALRQRFGRLNRRGALKAAPCVIVGTKKEIGRDPDPVYDATLGPTWKWLESAAAGGTLDISPEGIAAALEQSPAEGCVPKPQCAPVLRAADIAFFAMTSPVPHPDPYLPLFLHGEIAADADVGIVWRADCEIIGDGNAHGKAAARAIIACMPPRVGEMLRVPLWAARAWLNRRRRAPAEIADTEAARAPDLPNEPEYPRWALRWRGADDAEPIRASELRPGDVIVVPASYGGCDGFGWAPDFDGPATDVAEKAARAYRTRGFALRLHSALWPREEGRATWGEVQERLAEAAQNGAASIVAELESVSALPDAIRSALNDLTGPGLRLERAVETPYSEAGWVLVARQHQRRATSVPATESDAEGSAGTDKRSLRAHAADVLARAEAFAAGLGLDERLRATLAFAALHHDDGKADERFQYWLCGPVSTSAEPLAKSGRWLGHAAESTLRRAAGVPEHWRHEVLSVRAAMARLASADAPAGIDADLALFLIGSHHGQGRPFFEHKDSWDSEPRTLLGLALPPGPGSERLDFEWNDQDWAELFAGLRARYGTWGLAFLEAVLRLADHRASENPASENFA